jgi:hypothetical protein
MKLCGAMFSTTFQGSYMPALICGKGACICIHH